MGTGQPRRRPARISVPSRADALLRSFTELIGGPLGQRTSPGIINPGTFTVERVLVLLTTAAAILAVVIKNPCRVQGWAGPDQYYMACHSQWPETFTRIGEGISFLQLGYPAPVGAVAGVMALLVPSGDTLRYYDLHSVLAVAAWLTTVVATVRMTNRRPWDAAMVAVAPVIVLAGLTGWDLWATALGALGTLAFARHRFVAAGLLLGLGTAAAGYPVLIFAAVVLLAVRTGEMSGAARTGAALAAAWLAVNLPFAIQNFESWAAPLIDILTSEAGHSSAWFVYNALADRAGAPQLTGTTITVVTVLMFAVACAGISALTLLAPRRPRVAQVSVLLVGALIITGKEYSPQQAIWLIPLVALAYPKWRTFLIWQLLAAAHWWTLMLYLGMETSGGDARNNIDLTYYLLAVLAHMLSTAYVLWRVAAGILEPAEDPVRRLGIDDPQGGPFDQAADRRTLDRHYRSGNRSRVRLSRSRP